MPIGEDRFAAYIGGRIQFRPKLVQFGKAEQSDMIPQFQLRGEGGRTGRSLSVNLHNVPYIPMLSHAAVVFIPFLKQSKILSACCGSGSSRRRDRALAIGDCGLKGIWRSGHRVIG